MSNVIIQQSIFNLLQNPMDVEFNGDLLFSTEGLIEVVPEPKKIEDFGVKIGGAKKDLWASRNMIRDDLEDMTDREKSKFVKKDNIWKKPDYEQLSEEKGFVILAYLTKIVRDSLPADVKGTKGHEEYIELVSLVRDEVENAKCINDFRMLYNKILYQHGYIEKYGISSIRLTDKGYKTPGITNKFLKALNITDYDIRKAEREIKKTGFPEKQEAWRKNISIKEKSIPEGKEYEIVKRHKGYLFEVLATGFKSEEAAEKCLVEELKPLLTKKSKSNVVKRPQFKHIQRTGPDVRQGKEVTPEMILNTFGFRGGEFGNWLNQEDRQQSLNYAYEALLDLAGVLKTEPKAISLNSELGIAFGSRGSGNAAAHYEPTSIVINLTKMKGAGALAHEFAHALDDYLGRVAEDITGTYLSEGRLTRNSNISLSFLEAWNYLIDVMFKRKKEDNELIEEVEKEIERHFKYLESHLKEVSEYLSKEQTYGKARRAATEKEMQKIESLLSNIRNRENAFNSLEELSEIHKKIKGIMLNGDTKTSIDARLRSIDSSYLLLAEIKEGKYSKTAKSNFYKEAEELDKGRSKVYWSRRCEMFARAFEAYIEDRLGFKSNYLVHSTHNTAYLPLKPYPEKEERENINRAFDRVIEALKLPY